MSTTVAKPPKEERRLVTCMFVDVVGSTEMTIRLGAERLKRELGIAFGEISAIVRAHGGTVEKYVGDAVYVLFGAPVAHDDDALRALRAADAIRQWCATAGARHGHAVAVRIGVETGEAVVDLEAAATTRQQMSVGAVVNIAARLQQRAEPGEILIGPTAREATEGAAELESIPDLELKGVGVIPAWRLVRVGTPALRQLRFVGRDAELGVLALAHDRAKKGRSVLAVVSGPPGQGKTRLIQEFLRERANGTRVIATRCRPPEEVGVFAPIRQVLGVTTFDELHDQIQRICTDELECERVVAGLAESAGIATSGSLSRLPAPERDDEVVQAWRRYISLLGADRLVILAIDDIHWADPSLVRLVDRITFGGPRVLVVATARPEFAGVSGIRPSGDRFFVELEGLEPEEARRLAAEAGRHDERVVERAEGNPLFLVELARARSEAELPLTLQGALGARLDELAPAERALLSSASVAGERFTAADAAFLAEREVADAGRALARLADLHFLDLSEDDYRFHHGLVRDVAYGRLLAVERMRAHARFAQERVRPDDVSALAYHWWEALRPPDAEWVWGADPALPDMRAKAFQAHLAAGKRHGEHFAIDRAVELLERAEGFAASDVERAEAARALGMTRRRILQQDAAWAQLQRALAFYRSVGSVPADLYGDLLQTAAFTGAFRNQLDPRTIDVLAAEGITAAKAAGDEALRARILRGYAQALLNQGRDHVNRAGPVIEEAIEAARASRDDEAVRVALITKASHLRMQGRPDEALPILATIGQVIGLADSLDQMNYLRMRSAAEFLVGDLDAAERTATEAAALAEPMGPHNRTHAWSHLSDVYTARGEWARVIDLAQRTARLVREETASAFCRSSVGILRDGALGHALAGQREEALALLRAMPTTDTIEVDIARGSPRALLGLASPETDEALKRGRYAYWEYLEATIRAVALGRPDDAEAALAELHTIAQHSPVFGALATVVRSIVAELRGGPPATYEPLERIGFKGWAEMLRRRATAEY